ncbi:universal stress protein [Streptomyces spinosirectus]
MSEQKTLWDYAKYAPRAPLHGHVLVGVDGSDRAMRALDRAVAEAQARWAPLEILHGWPWAKHGAPETETGGRDEGSLVDRAHNVMESAVERVRERAPELDVIATLSPEPAASELVRRGERAALTVVGNRGWGEYTTPLAGSVGLRVAAHCAGPLLVVRGESADSAYGRPGHETVVVGVADDTDAVAARFAFGEAQQGGARVQVLHASTFEALLASHRPVPAERLQADLATEIRRADAVPRMTVATAREKFPEVEVQIDTVWGGAAEALVEASRTADTVVIAAHRRHTRGPGRRLGPVTHALLHRAHCPVVLVPAA